MTPTTPDAQKLPSVFPEMKFSGTARECGRRYGEFQADAIPGFFNLEIPAKRRVRHLAYGRNCWNALERWEPEVVEFVRGMSEGSGVSLLDLTLLLLHEELMLREHEPRAKTSAAAVSEGETCMAVGATRTGTVDGRPIIGQNWDWSSTLYGWPSILRLKIKGQPASVTYNYPGLWACAGVNEAGLGVVWTTSGIFPKITPRVGIPIYALLAGILRLRTCREAIELMQRSPITGGFDFVLGDATGEVWVVEGGPGRIDTEQCVDVISRANHYQCPSMCRAVRQKVPRGSLKSTTRPRAARAAEILREIRGRVDAKAVEGLLSDHQGNLHICQHPTLSRTSMTLDSLYVLPESRELWIARGLPCRHRFECHQP